MKTLRNLLRDNTGYGTGELMVIFVGLAGLALTVFAVLESMFLGGSDGEVHDGILGGVGERLEEVIGGVGSTD